jgi:predicted aspartyl protease
MQLLLKGSLPFITITVAYKGKTIEIPDILVDTGSASTILATDRLADIDIKPAVEDVLHTIRGVGGVEVVFLRAVDYLKVGERSIAEFEIEVGGMDYGFNINGILGMDFLVASGAVINLQEMQLDFSERK